MRTIFLVMLTSIALFAENNILEPSIDTYDITYHHEDQKQVVAKTVMRTSPVMQLIEQQPQYAGREITMSECVNMEGGEICPQEATECAGVYEYSRGETVKVDAKAFDDITCKEGFELDTNSYDCLKLNTTTCSAYPGSVYDANLDKCALTYNVRHYFWLSRCYDDSFTATMVYTGYEEHLPPPRGCAAHYTLNNIDRCNTLDGCVEDEGGTSGMFDFWSVDNTRPEKCSWRPQQRYGSFRSGYRCSTNQTPNPYKDEPFVQDYITNAGTEGHLWGNHEKTKGAYGLKYFYKKYTSSPPVRYQDHNGWYMLRSSPFEVTDYFEPVCPADAPRMVGQKCYKPSECTPGYYRISDTQCQQDYSYYLYSCPTDINIYDIGWEGPLFATGSDCLGECPGGRTQDCKCNNPTPPNNNCKRRYYRCTLDPSQKCEMLHSASTNPDVPEEGETKTFRSLIKHAVSGGVSALGYGMDKGECSGTCSMNIKRLYGVGSKIFASAVRTLDEDEFIEVDGCGFSGEINGDIAYITLDATGMQWNGYSADGTALGSILSSCEWNGKAGFVGDQGFNVLKAEGDKIVFFASYATSGRGYPEQGFLQVVPEVDEGDIADGYDYDIQLPLAAKEFRGDVVGGYLNRTIVASSGKVTESQCNSLKAQFALFEPSYDNEVKTRYLYSIVLDPLDINDFVGPNGSKESNCLLEKVSNESIDDMEYASKSVVEEAFDYMCSPLRCVDHQCGTATCIDSFLPEVHDNAGSGCEETSCDANLPFFEKCGIIQGCDPYAPDQVFTGTECYQLTCNPPQELNTENRSCDASFCKEGFSETTEGLCIED